MIRITTTTIMTMMAVILAGSFVAAQQSCSQYCGSASVLDRSVGPSGSVDTSAYYFYNNTYSPSVYVTSTSSSSCPVLLTISGNSLTINGTVVAVDGSNAGFYINFQLSSTGGGNPLLELQPNQYKSNGGSIDPTTFSYYSLSQGTLTGYGTYQGVVLTMSEFMHPLMIGTGADGKNLNFGSSGWFSYTDSNGTVHQTDLNLDLSCYCNAASTCSSHGTCNSNGSCSCSTGYSGTSCNQCASGYTGYPNCVVACSAATTCSGHGTCNGDGSCTCNTGYTGASCNQCASGYYGYPNCVACSAATTCSGYGTCNGDGSCACNTGYTGASCNQCASGYYGYPNCVACNAATTCSGYGTCNGDGSCTCNTGYTGASCNQCASGYYGYPNCVACDAATTCSGYGTCSSTGACICNTGFDSSNCGQCAANYYNYPSCIGCNAATNCTSHGTCTSTGACACNTGFNGTNCDSCATGYSGYPNCTLTSSSSGGVIGSPTSTPVNNANIAAVSWCILVALMIVFA